MKVTIRALVVATVVLVGTAVLAPDAGERALRAALLAVGAAFVADLVLLVARALPSDGRSPFAPAQVRPTTAWCPQGLTELDRDLAMMAVPGDGRRLPMASRLRTTSRAAAGRRLAPLGLDLDRPEDATEIEQVLGAGPYGFLAGSTRTVDPVELLAAVSPSIARDPAGPGASIATGAAGRGPS